MFVKISELINVYVLCKTLSEVFIFLWIRLFSENFVFVNFIDSETTEGTQFDTLLEMVADLGRNIFKLFQVSFCLLPCCKVCSGLLCYSGDVDIFLADESQN